MKMIGMSVRSTARRFCSSRPSRPGRETSRTRQLGTTARGQSRNSCADAKVFGCQPSFCISSSRDSRTEISSSTTNTIGAADCIGAVPNSRLSIRGRPIVYTQVPSEYGVSIQAQRCVQRIKQGRVAKRLVKKFHRSLFECSRADSLFLPGGNKDDGNFLPSTCQFLLKIKSRHSRHHDVENQTPGLFYTIG